MKSDWKWNFVAQTGLALIIALSACFIFFVLLFIVPPVVEMHSLLDKQLPDFLTSTISVAHHFVSYWYVWLILAAGALGLFEWKCKSENKALIRTFIGVGASLFLIVIAFWVAGAAMVSLVLLH